MSTPTLPRDGSARDANSVGPQAKGTPQPSRPFYSAQSPLPKPQAARAVPAANQSTNVLEEDAARRITELSAKIRAQTAQLESLRAKNQRLQEANAQLKQANDICQKQLEKMTMQEERRKARERAADGQDSDQQAQRAASQKPPAPANQQKATLMANIGDLSVKVNTLTTENYRLRKILSRETGRDVSEFNDLISFESDFKGRAEQIAVLSAKVKRLEKERDSLKTELAKHQGVPGHSSGHSSGQPTTEGQAPQEILEAEYVNSIRQQYQEQIQSLTELVNDKLQQLTEANEEKARLQEKNKTLFVRVGAIQNSLAAMRESCKVMVEKSRADDDLISDLRQYIEGQTKTSSDAEPSSSATRAFAAAGGPAARQETASHIAALELKLKLAQAKLSEIMQTVALAESSPDASPLDKAICLAALAQSEAHKMRELLEQLEKRCNAAHERIRELEGRRVANAILRRPERQQVDDAMFRLKRDYEAELAAKDFEIERLKDIVSGRVLAQEMMAQAGGASGPSAGNVQEPLYTPEEIARQALQKPRKRVKAADSEPDEEHSEHSDHNDRGDHTDHTRRSNSGGPSDGLANSTEFLPAAGAENADGAGITEAAGITGMKSADTDPQRLVGAAARTSTTPAIPRTPGRVGARSNGGYGDDSSSSDTGDLGAPADQGILDEVGEDPEGVENSY